MMTHRLTALFVGVAVSATAVFAQQPPGAVSPEAGSPEIGDVLVARLGDPDEARAEAAAIALIRGGKAVVPALRAALKTHRDPRFVTRAERVLTMCEVDAPATEGLRIGLRADDTELAPGEQVRLTATLCNVSDEPIVLYVGMSYAGNVFETGQSVRAIVDGAPRAARFAVGFCGTGAHALTVEIPPWRYRRFTCTATLRTGDERTSLRPGTPHLQLGPFLALPLELDATHTLQLVHEVESPPAGHPRAGERPPAPPWRGRATSNSLQLTTRRRAARRENGIGSLQSPSPESMVPRPPSRGGAVR